MNVWCFADVAATSWELISLMIDSYGHIAGTLRATEAASGKLSEHNIVLDIDVVNVQSMCM